jgi:hypothetical protein
MRALGLVSVFLTALAIGIPSAQAVEPIGAAAKVVDTLTSPAGKLETGGSVYFNDLLKTDATGVGQIIFKDDTKLAIGPNAEVKIDKFVYNDDGSFKELAVGMTKGAFRWISGKSKPEAYKLSTGWANLAIRGTAFDLNVDPDAGTLQLVLYEGKVEVCLATGGCQTIQGRCQYLTSDRRISVNDPSRLRRKKALELKESGLIPFIDNERLIKPFHLKNASCKIPKAQKTRTRKAQRAAKTKAAAVTTSTPMGLLGLSADVTVSDPTPSVNPDTPTSTDPGTKPGTGTKGKGRRGNPGNSKAKGNAGESPGGGDFGGGSKGKSDSRGRGGKGRGGGKH